MAFFIISESSVVNVTKIEILKSNINVKKKLKIIYN